jgi:hypothetical protein
VLDIEARPGRQATSTVTRVPKLPGSDAHWPESPRAVAVTLGRRLGPTC